MVESTLKVHSGKAKLEKEKLFVNGMKRNAPAQFVDPRFNLLTKFPLLD